MSYASLTVAQLTARIAEIDAMAEGDCHPDTLVERDAIVAVVNRRNAHHYHTLLARENRSSPWCIEFGAYIRDDVKDELDDYADRGYKRVNLRIISTSPAQVDITAAVAALNAKEA